MFLLRTASLYRTQTYHNSGWNAFAAFNGLGAHQVKEGRESMAHNRTRPSRVPHYTARKRILRDTAGGGCSHGLTS
jgi:hypothetical protein